MKTHEAEYQNSANSLALYRRALAALGSPDNQSNEGLESSEELVEEDNEEDSVNDEVESNSSSSPKMPAANSGSSVDYNSRLTVTV